MKKVYSVLPYLLIVSAFGIYLGGGLRIEHLILYPLSILFVVTSLLGKKKVLKNQLILLTIWITVLAVSLLVTFLNEENKTLFNVLADMESFLQPLFLMFLFVFVSKTLNPNDNEQTLITASKTLLVMLTLNTFFVFASIFTDVSQIGKWFWGGDGTWSVAMNAAGNGRYSGIFNQPMESGVMYSIGLFAWLYLSEKINVFKLKYILVLYLMLFGGLVSVSKIFIFGGIGLFLLGVLFNKRNLKMMLYLVFGTVILGTIAYQFLLKTWMGLNYLLRFFGSNQDFMYLLTAGRFGGENSQQSQLFSNIWNESPLFGIGFGMSEVYDSGYYHFFAIAGTIGLVALLLIIILMSFTSMNFLNVNRFGPESKFFFLLLILIIGGSFGSPVFTLNRVSIVLWVFLGLLYQYYNLERMQMKSAKSLPDNGTSFKLKPINS